MEARRLRASAGSDWAAAKAHFEQELLGTHNQCTYGKSRTSKNSESRVEVWNTWRKEQETERIDRRGLKLWRANLSKANLRGANLKGADLSGADLSNAHLNKADLSGADLTGTEFNGANLSKADLNSAHLSGARFHLAEPQWCLLLQCESQRSETRLR